VRNMPKPVHRFLLALSVSLALVRAGCLPGSDERGHIEDLLQQAIDELGTQPGRWQEVLSKAAGDIDRVGTDLSHQIASDVQQTSDHVLGQTENFVFCSTDFFGRRARQSLQHILHELDQNKPDAVAIPVVCNTEPGDRVDAAQTRLIVYHGYDFTDYEQAKKFVVDLEYASGDVVKRPFGFLAIQSNQQMTVDLQAEDWSHIDASRGPRVVLKWGDTRPSTEEGGKSEISVIMPALPPVPNPPATRWEDFEVNVHADPGRIDGECKDLSKEGQAHLSIGSGWKINRSMGDAGHPGIQQLWVSDNKQATSSLRSYNYQPTDDEHAQISGTICGASFGGSGAIFHRGYRVFEIERP